MPQTHVQPTRRFKVGRDALRIVLFGLLNAGKTSLLKALNQAADSQGDLLNGQLTDLSGRMIDLQTHGDPEPTKEETVAYPIRFEPRIVGREFHEGSFNAVVFDSNGALASGILFRQDPLNGARDEGSLAISILQADTIFLVVDTVADSTRIEADFDQFARFLELLERSRGRRIDISGLPVFLVLAKCDLLAQPGDTPSQWMDRIEERKVRLSRHFKDFLSRERSQPKSPFGRIDLHLWATAIKRPALAGGIDKTSEPFGVSELFRQGLASAQLFRRKHGESSRKLFQTVTGLLAAMVILCGFAAILVLGLLEATPTQLDVSVDRFRAQQQSLGPLAAHRTPKAKIEELRAFLSNPSFSRLPEDKQGYVRHLLDELLAYQDYEQKLREITDPRDATNDAQLEEIEESLRAVSIPAEYNVEWSQTDAGRRRADWLEDIAAIREAVQKVNSWYQKLIQDGRQVLNDLNGPKLPVRARRVLQDAATPPFPENDRDQLVPGSRRVTYDTIFRFASAAEMRRQWDEEIKKRLEPYAKLGSS
jgi:hypothetical protein